MLLNSMGRFNPTNKCRVFSNEPKSFYKISNIEPNYAQQHNKAVASDLTSDLLDKSQVETSLKNIRASIEKSKHYRKLFNAPAIPFCLSVKNANQDLGTQLEKFWLPLLKKEYEKQTDNAYFKATLQGNVELRNNVRTYKGAGYETFLESLKQSSVVGYYFPTAFQEYDIESQRRRITTLPKITDLGICLSGPYEIIYALVSYPKLLSDERNYSPILCASAFEHEDPRMIMLFKSYGPHLEFWLMTQMLTPNKTQVSEQWSGGLTIFRCL